MNFLDNILFALLLGAGIGYFTMNVKKLIRNIKLGQDVDRSDNSSERWKNMMMVALGQSKMVKRPIAGFLHIVVYVGFVIINIEIIESNQCACRFNQNIITIVINIKEVVRLFIS